MGYQGDINYGSWQARGGNGPILSPTRKAMTKSAWATSSPFGNAAGDYDTKKRPSPWNVGHDPCIFVAVPGPKMIWQWGELGYESASSIA